MSENDHRHLFHPPSSSEHTTNPIITHTEPSFDRLHSHDTDDVKIFQFNLSNYSKSAQLLICVLGTFLFYLLYGFIQEKIFKIEDFNFGWYLTLCQFLFYAFFSALEGRFKGINLYTERRSPLKNHIMIAIFMVLTMGLSNSSLQYLNYPTQVLIKSCKIIPSMIGGFLFFGRRYSLLEIISGLLLSIGLLELTLGNAYSDPLTFNLTGIIMLISALFADSMIGNNQEKVMTQYNVSTHEMIYFTHTFGSVFLFLITLFTGQLFEAVSHTFRHPMTFFYIACFSSFGYIGVNVVLALIKIFGSYVAISITSCRKFMTVWLSFLIFPKPITIHYYISYLFILLGIGCHIYHKNSEEIKKHMKSIRRKYFSMSIERIGSMA